MCITFSRSYYFLFKDMNYIRFILNAESHVRDFSQKYVDDMDEVFILFIKVHLSRLENKIV